MSEPESKIELPITKKSPKSAVGWVVNLRIDFGARKMAIRKYTNKTMLNLIKILVAGWVGSQPDCFVLRFEMAFAPFPLAQAIL
jgi:hypothetical protein